MRAGHAGGSRHSTTPAGAAHADAAASGDSRFCFALSSLCRSCARCNSINELRHFNMPAWQPARCWPELSASSSAIPAAGVFMHRKGAAILSPDKLCQTWLRCIRKNGRWSYPSVMGICSCWPAICWEARLKSARQSCPAGEGDPTCPVNKSVIVPGMVGGMPCPKVDRVSTTPCDHSARPSPRQVPQMRAATSVRRHLAAAQRVPRACGAGPYISLQAGAEAAFRSPSPQLQETAGTPPSRGRDPTISATAVLSCQLSQTTMNAKLLLLALLLGASMIGRCAMRVGSCDVWSFCEQIVGCGVPLLAASA